MTSYPKNAKKKTQSGNRIYRLEQSCFYRLERKKDLAALLRISTTQMSDLINERSALYDVREEEVNGKQRLLQVPRGKMRRCHSRLLMLLRRIRLPDYIKSPKRGSSSWKNASAHLDSEFITTFDIKKFYPSTTEEHLFRLFKYKLLMSDDCSRILAQICTIEGYLPQGSPASPHLACLAHLDLFDVAAARSSEVGALLSVWVDDIVISGASPRRDIQNLIKNRAKAKGLVTHKDRKGGGNRGIEITGAYLKSGSLVAANSSHLKMKQAAEELKEAESPVEQYRLFNRLSAMARYQRTVIKSAGGDVRKLNSRIAYYRQQMRKLDEVLRTVQPTTIISSSLDGVDGDVF